MSEPDIRINGTQLDGGDVMTLHVALQSFAGDLRENGLGDDEHGRRMTAAYLARVARLSELMFSRLLVGRGVPL